MRQSACISAAVIVSVGVLLFTTPAHAQEGTPSQPPAGTGTPSQPPATPPPGAPGAPATAAPDPNAGLPPVKARNREDDEDEDHIKHIALVLNPLGFAIGRYGIQGEYVFAKHHAVTLNPFFNHTTVEVNNVDIGSLNGFGVELGYRLYTGSKGSNGFFIGPSFLFASWSQGLGANVPPGTKEGPGFTALGAALDLGGQAIIGPGVIVGGGFGLQYTKNSEEINTNNFNIVSAAIAGGGVRPRFLFTVGFAF